MSFDTVVRGGNVTTPAGAFTGDIGISGEKITALGEDLDAHVVGVRPCDRDRQPRGGRGPRLGACRPACRDLRFEFAVPSTSYR